MKLRQAVVSVLFAGSLAGGAAQADVTLNLDFGTIIPDNSVEVRYYDDVSTYVPNTSSQDNATNLRFHAGTTSNHGFNPIGFNLTGWNSSGETKDFENSTGYLQKWSGGIGLNRSSDAHAIDNSGNVELVIFEFDEAVTLTQITSGWPSQTSGYDSDITVLQHTGSPNIQTETFEPDDNLGNSDSMLSRGWDFVGHYGNAGGTVTNTGATAASHFWAIGAYLNGINPNSEYAQGADYFKLLGLTLVQQMGGGGPGPTPVPAPGVLALLALAGVLAFRRRKLAAAA